MGIPSYFSYIIKNYANIIRKDCEKIDYLFMDCNSIIYDCYYEFETTHDKTDFEISKSIIEEQLIKKVIEKIEYYIQFISPLTSSYITFDGVAPFAKMEQQRKRRYKTQFMTKISGCEKIWNTSAITPGTQFMELLSTEIKFYFNDNNKIIISCADEPGEGEQKIFKNIRDNELSNKNIGIYGLDSDLIMLSIIHAKQTKNIFVFREAPNFKSVLSKKYDKNEIMFMDISVLCSVIEYEMKKDSENTTSCLYDYIFMCFLLGNDFLPHFPSLNIRREGMTKLLETYKKKIVNEERLIDSNKKIKWKNVYIFLNEISKNEKEYIINENESRNKMENRNWSSTDIEELVTNVPIIYRQDEKYICPEEHGWEKRYYKILLNINEKENIKKICVNYLEGLEWVFKYYTNDCPDWKWKYNYHYPPLIKDIKNNIPTKKELEFIKKSEKKEYHPKTQLAYVLPYDNLYLLGESSSTYIREHYKELYPKDYEFKWAFKRYMWEAEAVLPEIKKETLKSWEKYFNSEK